MPEKLIIGITGEIKAGKTTIAKIFQGLGCNVIYCDQIVHKLLKNDRVLQEKLRNYFGSQIFNKGKIKRENLAQIAFKSFKNWQKLNNMIHPLVKEEVRKTINSSSQKYQIIDAPLLFEANLDKICDYLIIVKARDELRKKRRGKLAWEELKRREQFLFNLKDKERKADFVIENNFDQNQLRREVKRIWAKIKRR